MKMYFDRHMIAIISFAIYRHATTLIKLHHPYMPMPTPPPPILQSIPLFTPSIISP